MQIGQLLGLYNAELGGQPFLMLVDEGRQDVVTRYLEDASARHKLVLICLGFEPQSTMGHDQLARYNSCGRFMQAPEYLLFPDLELNRLHRARWRACADFAHD